MTNYEKVRNFHEAYELDLDVEPTEKLYYLRKGLIKEEWKEVREELLKILRKPSMYDKAALSKELADLLYVVYGTAATFGIPLDDVFEEVHDSNMSKLGEDGKPIYREDGKVLKGPNYRPADIDKVLNGGSKARQKGRSART